MKNVILGDSGNVVPDANWIRQKENTDIYKIETSF